MKIMIGCSSRDLIDKKYIDLADSISKYCSLLGYELVFGAASTGMMGKCYANFDTVYSYTVEKYVDDLVNIPSKEQFVLDTTFDRTKKMFNDSDIIIILPGGTGTYAEIFSILEENRSINNPCKFILFNYNHYYDNVIKIIDDSVNNSFNDKSIYNYISFIDNLDELYSIIKSVIE